MNRFRTRLRALAGIGLVALIAPVLSGCGAGQISQMATQEPAVNGNKITISKVLTINNTEVRHSVELRDIRIQADQNSDWIQPGRTVELVLVAVNQSPDVSDKLTGISSEIGDVNLTPGDPELKPSGMLFIGSPDGQRVEPGPTGSSTAAKASVALKQKISNGQMYKFTFKFEKAGERDVQVPISAPLEPPPHLTGAEQHG